MTTKPPPNPHGTVVTPLKQPKAARIEGLHPLSVSVQLTRLPDAVDLIVEIG
jgi:hypothetical protein